MTTVTIVVKCDDATHLYWREQGSTSWAQLTTDPGAAPSISVSASGSVTFDFEQDAGSAHDVIYRESPSSQSQHLPASIDISSGDANHVYFAKSSSSPRWYAGYVRVSSTK